MEWPEWLTAVSIAVIAVALVVLVIFLIRSLVLLKVLVGEIEKKIRPLEPLFKKLGYLTENTEERFSRYADSNDTEGNHFQPAVRPNKMMQVLELAFLGIALWKKIKKRS